MVHFWQLWCEFLISTTTTSTTYLGGFTVRLGRSGGWVGWTLKRTEQAHIDITTVLIINNRYATQARSTPPSLSSSTLHRAPKGCGPEESTFGSQVRPNNALPRDVKPPKDRNIQGWGGWSWIRLRWAGTGRKCGFDGYVEKELVCKAGDRNAR